MNLIKNLLAVLLFAGTFTILGILIDQRLQIRNQSINMSALHAIEENFDGEINNSKLISAMTSSLDPYSYYLSKDEYQKVLNQDKGINVGIGIVYSKQADGLKVLSVFPNSPASNAEIKSGQYILKMNNIDIAGLSPNELALLLKGDIGTNITIEFKDGNIITLTQQKLTESLSVKDLSSDTAYIKIFQFWPTTGDEFKKIISNLSNKQNIIIDLRDNLGGNTESMLAISKEFISNGVILEEKFKEGKSIQTLGNKNAPLIKQKITVLTNHETSSAAEELASALKENKRAKIIGESTYGKSSIANYFELKDGSAIHLTIGHWFKPDGSSINGKGVEPDIYVQDQFINGKDSIYEEGLKN